MYLSLKGFREGAGKGGGKPPIFGSMTTSVFFIRAQSRFALVVDLTMLLNLCVKPDTTDTVLLSM